MFANWTSLEVGVSLRMLWDDFVKYSIVKVRGERRVKIRSSVCAGVENGCKLLFFGMYPFTVGRLLFGYMSFTEEEHIIQGCKDGIPSISTID